MSLLIAGNWKMNGLGNQLEDIRAVAECADANPIVDVLMCVPSTLISRAVQSSAGRIAIGGEDCAPDAAGAFTGDISAEMLKDAGASVVLAGHSERRRKYHETDVMVGAKVTAASRAGLGAIICVGETKDQHARGDALSVCAEQIAGSLPQNLEPCSGSAIAYEPLWAIGSGQTPRLDEIAKTLRHIRGCLRTQIGEQEGAMRILYGGSITPDNARGILELPEVGGLLIGGASLRSRDLSAIIRVADEIAGQRSTGLCKAATCEIEQLAAERLVAPSSGLAFDPVARFANGWVSRNVEVGPFSWDDPPIYEGPIQLFRDAAAQAGFSDSELERSLGPVPQFIAHSFSEAAARWLGAEHLRRLEAKAASL